MNEDEDVFDEVFDRLFRAMLLFGLSCCVVFTILFFVAIPAMLLFPAAVGVCYGIVSVWDKYHKRP